MTPSKESNKKPVEDNESEKSLIDMFDSGLSKIKKRLIVLEEKLQINEDIKI